MLSADSKNKGHLIKYGMGMIKPFRKHSLTILSVIVNEMRPVFKDCRFRRIIWLGLINVTCLFFLLKWCRTTRSMGLQVYTHLILFDVLCLSICALSIWIDKKKPNQNFTFGYERFEVLAIFLSTTFAVVSSFFNAKKSIERWIYQSQIHTGRLLPGIFLAFVSHLLITFCMKNRGLNHVICASGSSWLQRHMTGISQRLCHAFPGLSYVLLPRINPFVLIGWAAGGILVITHFLIDVYEYHGADSIAAVCIAIMLCVTMFPMCTYCGKVLLQGTPSHILDLINKCLREASTLDGVLEFRNEHFWLLGFDKIVGSVHVRIRRDANEQLVLAHLMDKLSSLVSDVTIQVFKDEWAWSSSTLQILSDSFSRFPPASTLPPANSPYQTKLSNAGVPVLLNDTTQSAMNYSKPLYGGPTASLSKSMPYQEQFSSHNPPRIAIPISDSMLSQSVKNVQSDTCSVDLSKSQRNSSGSLAQSLWQYQESPNVAKLLRTDVIAKENVRNDINPLFLGASGFIQSHQR